jgi:hypothetical protein
MKVLKIVLIITVVLIMIIWVSPYRAILPGYHAFYFTPKKYEKELTKLESDKKVIAKLSKQKQQQFFINALTKQIFPFWYGTRWSFYGNTTIPGDGSIACGYFVTTTLSHAGVKLNRIKLAQCASEEMIRSLVQKQNITHFNSLSLQNFINGISKKGKGIYIIGLDNHTGFIYIDSTNEVRFIHASGRFPFCVINEKASESVVLEKSDYKVVGKISDDDVFLKNYFTN